jgi:hypothetical protein
MKLRQISEAMKRLNMASPHKNVRWEIAFDKLRITHFGQKTKLHDQLPVSIKLGKKVSESGK